MGAETYKRSVGFAPGAHGNFLCLTLDLCHHYALTGERIPYTKEKRNFDRYRLPDQAKGIFRDVHDHRISHDINIKVDDEITWLHQAICRPSHHNRHILDFEKNFFRYSHKHPVLHKFLENLPNWITVDFDNRKLKWIYKNRIFGKVLADWQVGRKRHKHTVLFSDFYDLKRFYVAVERIMPGADRVILKSMYKSLHRNLIHHPRINPHFGSMLYESWQEYVG